MKIVNVKGYEGLYCITEDSKIYSLRSGNELKQQTTKSGYKEVVLSKDGVQKNTRVHIIVFSSFNTRLSNLVIDHIDGDKTNNQLSNLRQITTRENTSRAKTNKSNYRGVRFFPKLNKYGAEVTIDKVRYFLGTFNDAEIAHNAYINAITQWREYGVLPLKNDRSVKLCGKCKQTLPIDDFYYVEGHGRSWMCKECTKNYNKEKRIKNETCKL